MLIKSFAKVNLTLKVISKLRSNLHEIQYLFDKIEINKIKKNKDNIYFKGPFSRLVKKKDNSILSLLKELRKLELISGNYSIIVTKNIPVFGGLGGGTSNAAFILKYLLKNKINQKLINKFTDFIGSDLRLFFTRHGFLKDLRRIILLKKRQNFFFVLVKPKIKCSTREIYSKVKKFTKKETIS